MVTAAIAASLASKPVRERLARYLPMDPESPVHSLALVLAVIPFGTQAASIFFANPVVEEGTLAPLNVSDLVLQELPFVILALVGVGLFIRRGFVDSMLRLGLVRPAWWHVPLALGAAGAFVGFSQAMDYLGHALTPGTASQIDATTNHLYGNLGGPVGIATLALAPGICEEILFRGALQPRLGLLIPALLFASIHTQYGFSFDALAVLVIAIGLGVIRRSTNTTTTVICHVAYNLVVGIGIAGQVVGFAVAAELALIAVVVYAVWNGRRQVPKDS
jgi:membrane protease YdiL (CAAX protease family)